MAVEHVINLLRQNSIAQHGVVNVRGVIEQLDRDRLDPVKELQDLLEDPRGADFRYYGLEGMRSLAATGRLSIDEGSKLLDMTAELAQQVGLEEYYKSISALAASEKTAPVLLVFIQERLDREDIPDWRWLAFFAAGMLVERKTATLPDVVAKKLVDQASRETDVIRASQLQDIVKQLPQE